MAYINKHAITGLLTFPLLVHMFDKMELEYITDFF